MAEEKQGTSYQGYRRRPRISREESDALVREKSLGDWKLEIWEDS